MTIIPLWLLSSAAAYCLWLGKEAFEFRHLALMCWALPFLSQIRVSGKPHPKEGFFLALPRKFCKSSAQDRPLGFRLGHEGGGTELGLDQNI